jgi:ribokinase
MKNDVILVVGSSNMDLVMKTRRFAAPGETLLGGTFGMFPGGKGANQAVACARLSGNVVFLGKMGIDPFGDRLVESLRADGVRIQHVRRDPKHATGIALITVDAAGQNKIIVSSGSNMRFLPSDIARTRRLFAAARVLLLQLEIPIETVMCAAASGHHAGIPVILNPAPARRLPKELFPLVDYITPNETELGQLTDVAINGQKSTERAARMLLGRGVGNVVVTLGSKGCVLVNDGVFHVYRTRRVRAVDTTAAGDAFNGALAVSLARGACVEEAVQFANDVASCSVTRMGAQASMPTMVELKRFRKTHS